MFSNCQSCDRDPPRLTDMRVCGDCKDRIMGDFVNPETRSDLCVRMSDQRDLHRLFKEWADENRHLYGDPCDGTTAKAVVPHKSKCPKIKGWSFITLSPDKLGGRSFNYPADIPMLRNWCEKWFIH